MSSGIYQIRNLVNNHIYIGSTTNFSRRQSLHFSKLKNYTHHSKYLQNAYNKYGEDNFVFEIIEYCDPEYLIEREQWYIDNYQPKYNINPTAGSSFGVIRSEETKLKFLGENNPFFDKKHSEETKKKMSERNIGNKNPMFGKHLSDETKRRISEGLTGKNNPRSHTVLQIDLTTNEILAEFESASLAAKITNVFVSGIVAVCNNRRKQAGGYKWQYLDNE